MHGWITGSESRKGSAKFARARIPYAKVLVVDDVPTNLDAARGVMKPYGMQVDCVSGGSAAIELIRNAKVKYNAIFMDHMMPGMDGIEATRIIREEIGTEYAKTVPIIALTANAVVGNEDMFLQKGFQDFLTKPIDITCMDVVINHWVRDKELEKKLSGGIQRDTNEPNRRSDDGRGNDVERRSSFDRIGAGGASIDGLDFEQGLKHFGGDEEIYLDVLKSYALNMPPLLEQLRGCTGENLPDYAIAVHGIKSGSRNIGAEPIGTLAENLEHAVKAGDFAFIRSNSNPFIELVEKLIADLSALPKKFASASKKTKKNKPDTALLARLDDACKECSLDRIEQIMNELESYEYEIQAELIVWLREQVELMQFGRIREEIAKYQKEVLLS